MLYSLAGVNTTSVTSPISSSQPRLPDPRKTHPTPPSGPECCIYNNPPGPRQRSDLSPLCEGGTTGGFSLNHHTRTFSTSQAQRGDIQLIADRLID